MARIKSLTAIALALAVSGAAATAAVTTESVVREFQADGYGWIEVKKGPTQMKVEAVRGTEKVEVVIDIASGDVLERETETASLRDQGRTGVQVQDRARDFTGRDDDSDDDDDHSGRSGHGSDDDGDDDGDDDRGLGRGSDDAGGDNRGGRGGDSDDD